MKSIPQKRKQAILAKMIGPEAKTIAQIAKEEGVSSATLYNWRNQARQQGSLMPNQPSEPNGWSSQDKFNAVLETAALSETQIAEYCRRKGLFPEQIKQWRDACANANDLAALEKANYGRIQRESRRQMQSLQKDLRRKEKALAEAAALLVLSKKAEAIWEGEDA